MKKIIYLLSISFGILVASCDYVSNPYPVKNANISDTASCPSPTFSSVPSHIKKILIEDFTGHTCPNCPLAATKLYKLDTMYPGHIIGLAEHVGSLAAPSPGYGGTPATSFLDDYTTSAGNAYNTVFTPYAIGLPQGMFNRKDFNATTHTHLKFYFSDWEPFTASIVNEASVVDLQININYDASTRKVCCATKDSFLSAVSGTYRLVAVLTQDGITSWQDSVGVIRSTYVFNHMLRDAITPTGAWGEPLVNGIINAGTVQIRHFAYTIPSAYNNIPCIAANCHIIAFIYNTTTQEIIQSEIAKVIP